MAYGKGAKNVLRRAVPTGKTQLSLDVLPAGKLADLLVLRNKYLETSGMFVDAVFSPEPLSKTMTGEEMHRILVVKQKEITDFNKAYVEKARLVIPNAIAQVEMRYFNRLYGQLRHCASKTDEKDPSKRQYFNIPVELQDKVDLKDLETLEAKIADLTYKEVLDVYRRVIINNDESGLAEPEVLVIRTIQQNRMYHHFLELSNPVPRGESIKVPVIMSGKALKRFDEQSSVASLAIEISQADVVVRTIIAKPDKEPSTAGVAHFLGRDFGMVNTVSFSLVKLDQPMDKAEIDRIAGFTKGEALEYLEGYSHPNDNIVKRVRYSGKNFLESIAAKCDRIDGLKSQIDTGYNKLEKLKGIICGYTGLSLDEWLPEGQSFKDRYIQNIYNKFFRLLRHVKEMKRIRLAIYAKIADIKKVWFGFLSNIEAALAKEHNAAVVRENLTILAKEKRSPDYKGRTFNKMINNGSKGQYFRRASDKLRWDGIPELSIQSYYTSTVCTIHALVGDTMRSGETFCCPQCGIEEHADEHAADTIANYFLLRPHTNPGASW